MLKVLIGPKERPFEEVIAAGSKEANILSHEQAGDVLLIAKQGYYIAQDEESTIKKAVERGIMVVIQSGWNYALFYL